MLVRNNQSTIPIDPKDVSKLINLESRLSELEAKIEQKKKENDLFESKKSEILELTSKIKDLESQKTKSEELDRKIKEKKIQLDAIEDTIKKKQILESEIKEIPVVIDNTKELEEKKNKLLSDISRLKGEEKKAQNAWDKTIQDHQHSIRALDEAYKLIKDGHIKEEERLKNQVENAKDRLIQVQKEVNEKIELENRKLQIAESELKKTGLTISEQVSQMSEKEAEFKKSMEEKEKELEQRRIMVFNSETSLSAREARLSGILDKLRIEFPVQMAKIKL